MSKQMIISISREFASGGRGVARILSEKYHLPLYDNNILTEIATHKKVDEKVLRQYDEIPRNIFLTRTVKNFNNSPEENIAQMQFEYLKRAAANGESFVVVGRCSEDILKDNPNLITFFILGDMEAKIKSVMDYDKVSREEAIKTINTYNKKRKMYHNYYCKGKWGDSRYYDVSINCSKLGIEATAELLADYIEKRIK